ncbi:MULTISPECIES: TetR/AcrR family transcriptional regulator [unclassified Streptomyces]|uniref:TetR/AcrR family transcriptional regulator n=1 Tax=unclassified Streptomyces TaxID=2593676 RepID=UPI0003A10E03|nr:MULTISPECIES: TetR/AcrR family transcriptional regulator [unclassified Streptomyces]MYT32335.1 TetR family transcriptional regulator [Streptomyces sp. SID8354]
MAESATPGRRRRGAELEHAIYVATLDEWAANGYGQLTMEGIAARAGTGKAALYRRWSGKQPLVLDALRYALPPLPEPDPEHSARENLAGALAAFSDVLAGRTLVPGIEFIGDLLREPHLRAVFAGEIIAPRLERIEAILREGVRSGEYGPEVAHPLAARTGPALILQTFLLTGEPPSSRELDLIIDTVLRRTATSGEEKEQERDGSG